MQLRLNKKILFYIFLIIFLSTLNNKFFSEIKLKSIDKIMIKGLEEKEKQELLNNFKLLNFIIREKITINTNKIVIKNAKAFSPKLLK